MRQDNSISNDAKIVALLLFVGMILADAIVAFYLVRERVNLAMNLQKNHIYLPIVLLIPEPEPTSVPTPTATQPATQTPETKTYTVKSGDTLFQIANDHGISVDDLAGANQLNDIDLIYVGQQLLIPIPTSLTATVVPGSSSP